MALSQKAPPSFPEGTTLWTDQAGRLPGNTPPSLRADTLAVAARRDPHPLGIRHLYPAAPAADRARRLCPLYVVLGLIVEQCPKELHFVVGLGRFGSNILNKLLTPIKTEPLNNLRSLLAFLGRIVVMLVTHQLVEVGHQLQRLRV